MKFFQTFGVARLSEISGLDYWNGIVEWTTGMTFADNFTTKTNFANCLFGGIVKML